ncbi:MAG: hypothetical protein WBA22_18505 [Candidatus Methanofastidiosia archaeon]
MEGMKLHGSTNLTRNLKKYFERGRILNHSEAGLETIPNYSRLVLSPIN